MEPPLTKLRDTTYNKSDLQLPSVSAEKPAAIGYLEIVTCVFGALCVHACVFFVDLVNAAEAWTCILTMTGASRGGERTLV